MSYSVIGILAIIIHLIVNQDIIWKHDEDHVPALGAYRRFLLGILTYYATDVLWGYFDRRHFVAALNLDTMVYFVAMGLAVFLWTQYVITYLEESNRFGTLLAFTGKVFFVVQLLFVVVNCFYPMLFWFDTNADYHAGPARYATLGTQIVMFLLTSVYTLSVTRHAQPPMRRRYRTIGLFGLAMVALIAVQIHYPLLPLYSMGYMIGSCLLHSFVLEDEKDEYRRKLEEVLRHEQEQAHELRMARALAYTDPLTGVKSKHAYVEAEEQMSRRIADRSVPAFGVVVFDLNGLKRINDTLGHEAGDMHIIEACQLICRQFKHSPVFRIGGDEFLVIMENEDYERRLELLADFDHTVERNLKEGKVVVSTGMAEYLPEEDNDYQTVFERADAHMYERKRALREMGAVMRA